ncbi:tyrosine/phenylalanine carboxypeptidase domain-containing protein [Candidatus Nanohalococcus occultus]|uniref:tyrosine/phenylalanine carboxypeptidase domain-containing protein n=1 Tax=Candidatus Nanohalococcus occultus TaxID=2978047 RepID=UPI0039DF7337
MKVQGLRQLESVENPSIEFDEENLIEELSTAAKILKNKASWTKNVGITNKYEEKQRFLEEWDGKADFQPEFKFKQIEYNKEKVLDALNQCQEAAGKIMAEELEKYGAETLDEKDFQEFFTQIFEQFTLFIELGANIESFEDWHELCGQLWTMPSENEVERSKQEIKSIEKEDLEEKLTADDLKQMFEAEFERLGIEYEVEIRDVGGCFNIPEERKLIVARGDGEERKFSRKEAEMLTVHETFHSVRAYNGYMAGEKSGFPDILGVDTPFYDQTEEGGAIYREHRTDASYPNQRFDYHLKRIVAYEIHNCENYQQDFQEIVETAVEYGASPARAFTLVSRNREVLRHQIYQTGYEEWEDKEEVWPLLIGKINHKWAEKLKDEVEAGGMFQEPSVSEEQLFEFSFKDRS